MLRTRFSPILVIFALTLAACSDDGPTIEPAPDAADTGSDTVDDSTLDADETEDSADLEDDAAEDVDANEEDSADLGDPDDDVQPVASTEQIDTLIDEANADGVVTGDEMTEILTESGTPEGQATCEGTILAELGVTDPTDIDQLQEVADQITEEMRIELSTCIASGG